MNNITAHIKKNEFMPAYLLYGQEGYLKRQFRDMLIKAVAGDGDSMNLSRYEGEKPDLSQIAEIADTMPFFADKRMIVIENSGMFKTAQAGEGMLGIVKNIPETTVFLFVEDDIDQRGKLFKEIKKTGYVCEMGEQNPSTLYRWVSNLLKDVGKVMGRDAFDYFLGFAGTSMDNIYNQLSKLISYVGDRDQITISDIDIMCVPLVENKIFDMISAISQHNATRAMELYYDLVALKEPPVRILNLIVRNFNQLYMIKELAGNGNGKDAIAARVKLNSYVVGKLMQQSKAFKTRTLRNAIEDGNYYDEAIKTGALTDSTAVEMLIVKYSSQE